MVRTNLKLVVPVGVAAVAASLLLWPSSSVQAQQKKGLAVKYLDPENAPKGEGWIDLCNGEDLTGWVQRQKDRPISWLVSNGTMVNFSGHEAHGTDIYTERKFGDFEAYYEYAVARGSNSGFYLRGRYEIQIYDDREEGISDHSDGSLYSVKAPAEKATLGPMKWQSVYVKLVGRKVTIIHNGKKIHDNFEIPRPTGGELDGDENQPGPIMVQGDHGSLAIRNIKIRPIGK